MMDVHIVAGGGSANNSSIVRIYHILYDNDNDKYGKRSAAKMASNWRCTVSTSTAVRLI